MRINNVVKMIMILKQTNYLSSKQKWKEKRGETGATEDEAPCRIVRHLLGVGISSAHS